MSTPIKLGAHDVDIGTPVKLFDPRILGGGTDVAQGSQYDVAKGAFPDRHIP